jgi:S-adenosylmethionine:tRNA ribosyltransferase-isomerase
MKLKQFDYVLPKNLIAQELIKPRDHSRLLVMDKKSGRLEHKHFYNIIGYLKKGDVLVLNNTKVMPARLIGKRALTGGKVEIFLLRKNLSAVWQCLVGGKKRKENLRLEFGHGLKAKILKNNLDGTWQVRFNKSGAAFMKLVKMIGQVPLPPYIKRNLEQRRGNDAKNYQTVYAEEKKLGSVAAPTAGFHFTKELIKKLKNKGVQFEYVTLQVGLGTFAPVKVDDITKHKMHAEWIEMDKRTLKNIINAKKQGRRIIAVGTTSLRTLETIFSKPEIKKSKATIKDYSAWTNIFIYPGYKFKIVDCLITNFHLPKSTLLMLVSAFAKREKINQAYKIAIKKKYRFFSFGDAMLII